MKRFFIFPATLGFVGAFLPVVCFIIGVLSLWPMITGLSYVPSLVFSEKMPRIWEASWPYGLMVGVFSGVALAAWDMLRNRRDESSLARLGGNLFWCGCYALLLNLINGALSALASIQAPATPPATWILMLPFISAALVGITAILWSVIRSITTDDALTPRVLRDKLRERSRLQ